ncbi:PCC domain-containing protein [Chryseobacterium sp. MMS23-Vi53]|uniref:PCC domain-containing protein n=1 Tax=Chryseobacterium sp. MMS23-Vi53 TaxID=3386644 RepID=UPI0039ECF68E
MNEKLIGNNWQARKVENNYIVIFDDKAEIKDVLMDFISNRGIKKGHFSGIGFLKNAVLNCFDSITGKYTDKEFKGLIIAFDIFGSILQLENQISIDLRMTFKFNDEIFYDNHLLKGKVYEKIEMIFYSADTQKVIFTNKISLPDINDFSYN